MSKRGIYADGQNSNFELDLFPYLVTGRSQNFRLEDDTRRVRHLLPRKKIL
jgi:hypothetical protein